MNQNVSTLKELEKWVVAPSQPQETAQAKLENINQDLEKINHVETKQQFAFENTSAVVREKKNALMAEKQKVERDLLNYQMATEGYVELDYSPLGWRKKNSLLPAFYILNIDHSSVTLRINISWGRLDSFYLYGETKNSSHCSYPVAVSNIYKDAAQVIYDSEKRKFSRSHDGRIVAEAKFQGILPDKTRGKIESALQSKLFDEIYIIAEAKDWKINTVITTRADPIIVGWVERTEQMFIIDIFDPTPLEEYLAMSHSIIKS